MRRTCSLAALAALLALSTAEARRRPVIPAGDPEIAAQQAALARAAIDAAAADRRAAALTARAAQITDEADKARATAAAVAAEVQAGEADFAAAQARLAIAAARSAAQRAVLARQQAPLTRLLAALETMARRPAALTVVEPGSLRDMVHVRALLGSAMPAIAQRTVGLKRVVAASNRLRAENEAAVAVLRTARAALEARRTALARIEQAGRVRSAALADSAMLEQERAQGLGEKAHDITALMEDMAGQAEIRERLATLPGPLPRPAMPGAVPTPPDDPRAAAGAGAPAYRVPAVGRLVGGMGETTASGLRSRGLTIATAPAAQVVAPAAGRISYATAFRRYGTVVIIDHGGGWTTSLTDLTAAVVRVGDVVVQGSPIGRAGPGTPTITVELRHGAEPVDIGRLVSHG